MATKKAGGSSKNGRDSRGRRLGVKVFHKQKILCGSIVLRQRGTKWHPGFGVFMGSDHTIHAKHDGFVSFRKGGKGSKTTYVDVIATPPIMPVI